VHDQNDRYARLRHIATGALATLAVVGVIAGTGALAANPAVKTHGHATMPNGTAKTPGSPTIKADAPRPAVNHRPFFVAIERLVDNGTITATQGRAVDDEIGRGNFDSSMLTGFTQTQLQAVERALTNTKRALVSARPTISK
jgi:hypothetical protein